MVQKKSEILVGRGVWGSSNILGTLVLVFGKLGLFSVLCCGVKRAEICDSGIPMTQQTRTFVHDVLLT